MVSKSSWSQRTVAGCGNGQYVNSRQSNDGGFACARNRISHSFLFYRLCILILRSFTHFINNDVIGGFDINISSILDLRLGAHSPGGCQLRWKAPAVADGLDHIRRFDGRAIGNQPFVSILNIGRCDNANLVDGNDFGAGIAQLLDEG